MDKELEKFYFARPLQRSRKCVWQAAEGPAFLIDCPEPVQLVVHVAEEGCYVASGWIVTEADTGMGVCTGGTREEATKAALAMVEQRGADAFKAQIEKRRKEWKIPKSPNHALLDNLAAGR